MTHRLYYEDAYLQAFSAQVTGCRPSPEGQFLIELDHSAFYPTSGGQPHDTGRIGPARVLDVFVTQESDLVHQTDAPLEPGQLYPCQIDWARRFDHMQQHGGEHIMAGSLFELWGGFTHGLHIGTDVSTIDVTMPDGRLSLSEQELDELSLLCNSRVQTAAPIRAWFPSPEEMDTLPLRKDPTVSESVRVVMVGDFECVACGGTHPANTGEIGLILPLSTAPARGKLRLSFVCGMRAVHHMQRMLAATKATGTVLSAPLEQLADAARLLRAQQAELRAQVVALKQERADQLVQSLATGAQALPDGSRLIAASLPEADMLREVAAQLVAKDGLIALLSAADGQGGERLVFARSANLPHDMATLLRTCGAKGGGKPDFAQGISPDAGTIERAQKLFNQEGDSLQP